ncbi:MAG: hypothetical protein KBT47_05595, partial [Armatimonadetes bacterium]|nr:hypothetical protein [Candidatus Hippobium faecium]
MKQIFLILILILLCPCLFASIDTDFAECDKVVYKPGDTATIAVRFKADEKATLTGYIYKNINDREKFAEKECTPKPDWQEETFTYIIPENYEWGYGVEFVLKSAGDTRYLYNYFAVGDRPYYYGHYGTVCNRGHLTKDEAEKNITWGFKTGHYGAIEFFSWEPSMWETMAPKEDKWIGGQLGYMESKENIKTIIDTAHKCGIDAFSYHAYPSWGYAGSEYLRTHAEWWNYDKHGKPFPSLNVYDTEIMEKTANLEDPGVHPTWIWWETGNLVFPGMLDYYLDQLKKSCEMFDWDGFREDGIAYMRDTYNAEGKLIKADKNLKEIPNFVRYVRKWIKENIGEDKTIHFNAGSVHYALEKTNEEQLLAEGEDRSYILWEGSHFSWTRGHELNDMRNFVKVGNEEVNVARKCGGQRYCYYESKTNEYSEAVTTAIGAKAETVCYMPLDNMYHWNSPVYRDFTFRFSEFFWDSELVLCDNPENIIKTNNNVFLASVQKKETENKIYYIAHLINPPSDYSITPEKMPDSLLNTEITYLGEGTPK